MPRLVVQGLCFSRGGRVVLRDLSFDHPSGQVLALLGPSGSGKTTLLWLLAGLLAPDAGVVRYEPDGADASRRPRFGFVFQDGGLWEHLTVESHLDLVLRGRGLRRGERRARTGRILDDTALTQLARRRPGQLSGGQRQRLALARALVVEPQWLLLDEPTSQLDGPARDDLLDLLSRQLRGARAGVVLATHQLDLALRLSGRVAVIANATVAQIASPEEVYRCPVSLEVARLLGKAFELDGRVLRPEDVAFDPDEAGDAVVTACHFAGGAWHLELKTPPGAAVALNGQPVAVGTRGRLRIDPDPVHPAPRSERPAKTRIGDG